jgi:hypothetical protein
MAVPDRWGRTRCCRSSSASLPSLGRQSQQHQPYVVGEKEEGARRGMGMGMGPTFVGDGHKGSPN